MHTNIHHTSTYDRICPAYCYRGRDLLCAGWDFQKIGKGRARGVGLLALRLCLGRGPFPLSNYIPIHQMTPCSQHYTPPLSTPSM